MGFCFSVNFLMINKVFDLIKFYYLKNRFQVELTKIKPRVFAQNYS
jgi:hypothetical protein